MHMESGHADTSPVAKINRPVCAGAPHALPLAPPKRKRSGAKRTPAKPPAKLDRALVDCGRQEDSRRTCAHACADVCAENGRPTSSNCLLQASTATEEDAGKEEARAQEDVHADAKSAQEISEFVAWGLPEEVLVASRS